MSDTIVNKEGTIYGATVEMYTQHCIECGVPFAFPRKLDISLRETHQSFCCPNGHKQFYPTKTEAEKVKEELRIKENEVAQLTSAKIQLESQLEKAKKTIKSGKCPCCNKTYKSLASHMKQMHPKY